MRSTQEEILYDGTANVRADLLSELNMGLPAGLALDKLESHTLHISCACFLATCVIGGDQWARGVSRRGYAQLCLRTFVLLFPRASRPPPSHESRKNVAISQIGRENLAQEKSQDKNDFLVNRYRLLVKPNVYDLRADQDYHYFM